MRQAVDADISRLRKMLDDTNVVRLHLESDIESLKEELITLRKHHQAVRILLILSIQKHSMEQSKKKIFL